MRTPPDEAGRIARAAHGVLDGDRGGVVDGRAVFGHGDFRVAQLRAADGCDLAGHADHGKAVAPVGGDGNVQDGVVQVHGLQQGLSQGRWGSRTQMPERPHPGEAPVGCKACPRTTDRGSWLRKVSGRREGRLPEAPGPPPAPGPRWGPRRPPCRMRVPVVDVAQPELVRIGMGSNGLHPRHDHLPQKGMGAFHRFHFQARHGEAVRKGVGVHGEVHIVLEHWVLTRIDVPLSVPDGAPSPLRQRARPGRRAFVGERWKMKTVRPGDDSPR